MGPSKSDTGTKSEAGGKGNGEVQKPQPWAGAGVGGTEQDGNAPPAPASPVCSFRFNFDGRRSCYERKVTREPPAPTYPATSDTAKTLERARENRATTLDTFGGEEGESGKRQALAFWDEKTKGLEEAHNLRYQSLAGFSR